MNTTKEIMDAIEAGLKAPRYRLMVNPAVALQLRAWINNPPPYVPPARPAWMADDTWAVYQLIHKAGDDAHWGALHVYIEDLNLDDWRFDMLHPESNVAASTMEPWERAIFDALAGLSERERWRAVTGHEHDWRSYQDHEYLDE